MTKQQKIQCVRALMRWHEGSARDLPWRGERDPYRIWVSEIMLQQTRTETVSKYYGRFIDRFPDISSLAGAPEDEVLKMWEGLGYYTRARNLMRAAKVIQVQHGGRLPDTVDKIRALPGVGPYTVGAIASMAFGLAEPAIDGNIIRVLTRLFGYRQSIDSKAAASALYDYGMSLVELGEPGEVNQALMGLGAMVCKPRPDCGSCPVQSWCDGYREGDAIALPIKPPRPEKRQVPRAIALVVDKGRVLVGKREERLLRGMYAFPGFDGAMGPEETKACLEEMGIRARYIEETGRARHVFTHLVWQMTGRLFAFEGGQLPKGYLWADREDLQTLAFPTALRFFREDMLSRLSSAAEEEA